MADPSPAIELPPAAGERESAGVAARPACVRQIFRRAALLLRACLPGGEREAQGGRPKRWERSAQGGCVWRERAVCAYGRSLGRQARPPPAYGLLPLLY